MAGTFQDILFFRAIETDDKNPSASVQPVHAQMNAKADFREIREQLGKIYQMTDGKLGFSEKELLEVERRLTEHYYKHPGKTIKIETGLGSDAFPELNAPFNVPYVTNKETYGAIDGSSVDLANAGSFLKVAVKDGRQARNDIMDDLRNLPENKMKKESDIKPGEEDLAYIERVIRKSYKDSIVAYLQQPQQKAAQVSRGDLKGAVPASVKLSDEHSLVESDLMGVQASLQSSGVKLSDKKVSKPKDESYAHKAGEYLPDAAKPYVRSAYHAAKNLFK